MAGQRFALDEAGTVTFTDSILEITLPLEELTVIDIQHHSPAGAQQRLDGLQQRNILLISAVTKRLPQVHGSVEGSSLERNQFFTFHLLERRALPDGGASSLTDGTRITINSEHRIPALCKQIRMSSVTAADVEQASKARQWQLTREELNLTRSLCVIN